MTELETIASFVSKVKGKYKVQGDSILRYDLITLIDDDPSAQYISAIIDTDNEYFTTLQFSSDFRQVNNVKIVLYCDCDEPDYCQHQYALLKYFLDGHGLDIPENTAGSKSKLKQKKHHTGEWRNLPIKSHADGMNILNSHQPKRFDRDYQYSETVLTLTKNAEFEVELMLPTWYNSRERKQAEGVRARIRNVASGLEVKCEVCNKHSNKLCNHTYYGLEFLIESSFFLKYISPKFNLEDIYKKISEIISTPLEITRRFYTIRLCDQGTIIHKTNPNFSTHAELLENISKIDNQENEQSSSKQRLFRYLEEKAENLLEFGFIWPNPFQYESIRPRLISGKANKQKTKLASRLKYIDQPPLLNHHTKAIYDISHAEILNDSIRSPYENHKALLELLKKNVHALAKTFHFYITEDHPTPNEYAYEEIEKIKISKLQRIEFQQEIGKLICRYEEDEAIARLAFHIAIENKVYELDKLTCIHPYFISIKEKAYLVHNLELAEFILNTEFDQQYIFPKELTTESTKFLNILHKNFECENFPKDTISTEIILTKGHRQLYLEELGNELVLEPKLSFEEYGTHPLDPQKIDIDEFTLYLDHSETYDFLNAIFELHPTFRENYEKYGTFFISIEDLLIDGWYFKLFEKCKEQKIEVFGQSELLKVKYSQHQAKISTSIKSGVDWFDIDVDVEFGQEKIPFKVWAESIRQGNNFIKLTDGSLGLLSQQWFEKLRQTLSVADVNNGELQVNKLHFNIVDELFDDIDDLKLLEELDQKRSRLAAFNEIKKTKVPASIKATLRDYQLEGLNWLNFLDEFEFGGCLADDMGLGKTLQVLTFLAQQKEQNRGTSCAIVPRSLMHNWAAEIDKFCPSLQYLVYHGTARKKEQKKLDKYDLIISTYDTTTRDIEWFSEQNFNYIILDESQAIKNPASKRFKAMRLLSGRNKIVMTGTPIENNTFDLYAQFTFLNPGFFGSVKNFKTKFSTPIDVNKSEEAASLLSNLIHPFILRRTKEQVAKDLPQKTESVIFCEMDSAQRKLYETLKSKVKIELNQVLGDSGINKAKFFVIEGLLRLRQICNSPLLVDKKLTGANAQSAKLDVLIEHLSEIITNHKVIVFSQFTSMLALIKERLEQNNMEYCYLDGATRKRLDVVNEFQSNEEKRIFLISLKAGNTGLNLTAAEYVFIVDPWWNPATEAQAIDRTHRIGQKNQVFAYRLICKDSIEEKILELQSHKKKIASDIIHTDESVLKSLDKSQLMSLFE